MDDIITIDQLRQQLVVKALNRSADVDHAAQLLGVSKRTVFRYKRSYGVTWCRKKEEYILKNPQKIDK